METQLTNLPMPVAALLASLIGAIATISAALIQLRIAWRREMQAREKRQPVTKKARRGPVTPVMVLLLASAAGGFLISQYFFSSGNDEQAQLRARLDRLNASLQRLEQEKSAAPRQSVAVLSLGPCRIAGAVCTEQTGIQVTLCADLPATARVTGIERSTGPGPAKDTASGAETAGERFVGDTFERLDGDRKQVCQELLHWNGDQGHTARLVVHYTPQP